MADAPLLPVMLPVPSHSLSADGVWAPWVGVESWEAPDTTGSYFQTGRFRKPQTSVEHDTVVQCLDPQVRCNLLCERMLSVNPWAAQLAILFPCLAATHELKLVAAPDLTAAFVWDWKTLEGRTRVSPNLILDALRLPDSDSRPKKKAVRLLAIEVFASQLAPGTAARWHNVLRAIRKHHQPDNKDNDAVKAKLGRWAQGGKNVRFFRLLLLAASVPLSRDSAVTDPEHYDLYLHWSIDKLLFLLRQRLPDVLYYRNVDQQALAEQAMGVLAMALRKAQPFSSSDDAKATFGQRLAHVGRVLSFVGTSIGHFPVDDGMLPLDAKGFREGWSVPAYHRASKAGLTTSSALAVDSIVARSFAPDELTLADTVYPFLDLPLNYASGPRAAEASNTALEWPALTALLLTLPDDLSGLSNSQRLYLDAILELLQQVEGPITDSPALGPGTTPTAILGKWRTEQPFVVASPEAPAPEPDVA